MSRRLPALVALVGLAALPLVVSVTSSEALSAFPSIDQGSMSFSASVPSDVQRDEGEPEVSIDPAGNIYTCGPSGFSNIADYAQVSRDGGDQFHLIGLPPRGQISGGEGGGDCGLASAPYPNDKDQYTWAYTGLGPLTNFSTGSSDNTGQTLRVAPVSESIPGVDRQWMVFIDTNTVLFNYNHLSNGYTVQRSTDGGMTYEPVGQTVSEGGGRIGPMRAILSPDKDPSKAIVYFPSYAGTRIVLVRSMDGGATWGECVVQDVEMNPSAGFVIADHDKAGNIYTAFAQKGAPDDEGAGNDTYVVVAPAEKIALCQDDVEPIGTGKLLRVNRDDVETTVMPWLVAGGEPGRIAVAFYGTKSIGDPDEGLESSPGTPNPDAIKAAWYPYVSLSVNALDDNPLWMQERATAYPNHYDSICLGGLGCGAGPAVLGDRTLVDYFAMDLDPVTGRLVVVYNNAAKKPDELQGHVGHPIVFVQETGPSLLGGTLQRRSDANVPREVVRTTSVDNVEDALAPYGTLCLPNAQVPCTDPSTANVPALDIEKVTVGPEIDLETGEAVDDGGFTVTLELADISNAALQAALTSQTAAGNPTEQLLWLFRWINGYQPVGATVRWDPVNGFVFRFDDYTTQQVTAGQADPTAEKIVVWPGTTVIPGDANQDLGTLRLSIPRSLLRTLGEPDEHGRPAEVEAGPGSRLNEAVAYSFTNPAPPTQLMSYVYPVDNAPAMDFFVPGGAPVEEPTTGPTSAPPTAGPTTNPRPNPPAPLPATGGLGAPYLALLAAVVALLARRERRSGSHAA